jgi:ribonuclease Z
MNAENILLTHFSARYPRMPPSVGIAHTGSAGEREPIVALAFDHANLTIGSMWKLNMYLPVIQQTFADTSEEEDEEETKVALAAVL